MIFLIAICLTVLIGFAGLSTDTGMIWITRAQLQNSVDAAALAAAQELPASDPASTTGATGVACEYATVKNAVPGMFGKITTCSDEADVTFSEGGSAVEVKAYRSVQPIFGQILGFPSVEVSAQATARIGSLAGACVFPFFVTKSQITDNPAFFAPAKFTNDNDAGGAIDVGGGADGVRDAMAPSACSAVPPKSFAGAVGDLVDTKNGALDQFKFGWDDITAAAAASACPNKHLSTYLTEPEPGQYELSPMITLSSCPRLVIIPVLENGDYSSGNASGEIVGFIPFYFALKCNSSTCADPDVGALTRNDFWGYYVRLDLTSLSYSEYDPDYGTKIVSLAG